MSVDSYEKRLTKQLSYFIKDREFNEWVENLGDEFFKKYGNGIPIKPSQYFEKLNIKGVVYTNKIVSNGRIRTIPTGFIIELNDKLKTELQKNIYIAHEIAHTLFYKKIGNRFIHIEDIKEGTNDLEYACNRLARCLIIPSLALKTLLKTYPSLNSDHFTFKSINHLSKSFGITHKVLLIRLTNDLKLWTDFLLLRLKRFVVNDLFEWRLVENYFEVNAGEPLAAYIPPPDKYKNWENRRKYPKLKGKLSGFVENIFNNLKYGEEQNIHIKADDLIAEPLKTFMKNFEGKVFTKCLVSKITFQKEDHVNIMIKLSEEFIN